MHRRTVALLAMTLTATPAAARAQDTIPRTTGEATLEARMRELVEVLRGGEDEELVSFFPPSGTWRWIRTAHEREGDRVGVWLLTAADLAQALRDGESGLADAFAFSPEGTTVGTIAHQSFMRRGTWRRVRGNRFVPPGASAGSRLYVEWRREGGRWLVSEIGDESFGEGAQLPSWCC